MDGGVPRASVRRSAPPFFSDDGGFSTLGMVLALLITLSLVFTTAQVYAVYSSSSRVQSVADACALAAENQVASFYLAAQVCDAAVFTLTLAGCVCAGVGAAALCVPGGAGAGEGLLDTSRSVFEARDSFSRKAAEGLNAVQKMLPFIACAQAMGVAEQNSSKGGEYRALAVLLPAQGAEIEGARDDGAADWTEFLQDREQEIEDAAETAEDAARQMNEGKRRAWEADCGGSPYSMRERANRLAGLEGTANPAYSSPDNWGFSVALGRARAYYAARLAAEAPRGTSVNEQANSALRARFYAYAVRSLAEGYVREDGTSFEAYFPHLPANADEMRESGLYTEEVYPITASQTGGLTMHAWDGCPRARSESPQGTGSVQRLEQERFAICPECSFSATSLGSVAAASTSIDNGFEHYYRIVEEEAERYEQAHRDYASSAEDVRTPVSQAIEGFKEVMSAGAQARIEVDPPGKYGAVALVADAGEADTSDLLPNGFVNSGGVLGPRVALSAATLASDSGEEGADVLNSLLDGAGDKLGIEVTAPGAVLGAWSSLVRCYHEGYEGVSGALEGCFSGVPLLSESGLGEWAKERFTEAMSQAGLDPVEVDAKKPVIVNSWHVAQADGGEVGAALARMKRASAYLGNNGGDPWGALIDAGVDLAETRFDDNAEAGIEIARIELPGSSSLPITLQVPIWLKQRGHDYLDDARSYLHGLVARSEGGRVWE